MENSKINISKILNTEYSLEQKFVQSNSRDAYLSTSISSCNTSRKDGLLVCKDTRYSQAFLVLLSHIDEVIMNNACYYQLGFHRFPNCYFPNGLKYIANVELEPHLTVYYAVSNILLKKELFLSRSKAELNCVYTLEESPCEIDMIIKPFVAFRNVYSLCKAGSKNFKIDKTANVLKISESKDYPDLFINCSKNFIYTDKADWYYNFEYKQDQELGKEYAEDLFMPGQLLVSLKEKEQFSMKIGLEKIENFEKNQYKEKYLVSKKHSIMAH